ncbi:MAG: cytochrome c biogenesis CcdA family protein [Planctomycetota bacterium]|jgi:cytochrome c biogenesis protein CcdA
MQEWINQALESGTFSLAGLLAAFLLGLISSIACACCTLPVLGAVVGYSGMQKRSGHRVVLLAAFFFMLGTIIATVILGGVAGFIGQVAQSTLGKYWKVFAGAVAIFFGLAALKLLPFKLPQRRTSDGKAQPKGLFGAAVFGLVVGGGVGFCSLPCNPGIFIVLGVVVLKGYSLWAMAILVAYAIGFSLPLAAIVLGVSFGKMAVKAKKAETAVRIVAGILLIAAGFYFLVTL